MRLIENPSPIKYEIDGENAEAFSHVVEDSSDGTPIQIFTAEGVTTVEVIGTKSYSGYLHYLHHLHHSYFALKFPKNRWRYSLMLFAKPPLNSRYLHQLIKSANSAYGGDTATMSGDMLLQYLH